MKEASSGGSNKKCIKTADGFYFKYIKIIIKMFRALMYIWRCICALVIALSIYLFLREFIQFLILKIKKNNKIFQLQKNCEKWAIFIDFYTFNARWWMHWCALRVILIKTYALILLRYIQMYTQDSRII